MLPDSAKSTCVAFSAGDHVGGQGVARGGHAGLLRSGPRLRRRHRLLQLQQAGQQLPLRRRLGVVYQLLHLRAGHPGGVCGAGLQSQHNEQQVCHIVSESFLSRLDIRVLSTIKELFGWELALKW